MWDCVYIVGDSFAEGGEVLPKDSLGTRIAEHYELPLINKGLGGASNEYTFRKIYEDIPKLNSNPLVIIVYTESTRQDFYSHKYPKNLISITNGPERFEKDFVKEFFATHFDETNQIKKTLVYIHAIQTLLKSLSIDYIECFSLDDFLLDVINSEYYSKKINRPKMQSWIKIDDTSRMIDISLSEQGGRNKFHHALQDKSEYPLGHLTERGSELVAKWMIEKINILYPNQYLNKVFNEKYI
jgi:hypothetical protein